VNLVIARYPRVPDTLRDFEAGSETGERYGWLAINPEPVHGDLALDPCPLLTQFGDD
jgi:hypothetical protein